MKPKTRLLCFAFTLAVTVWIGDALSHYWGANDTSTFASHLIGSSIPETLMRFGLVGAFLIFCGLSVRMVSRARRIEETLIESEAMFRGLAERSDQLVWRCDNERRTTYLNPAWEQLLGHKIEDMLGRCFTEFQPTETAIQDHRRFDAVENTTSFSYETTFRTKAGLIVQILQCAVPTTDSDGEINGFQGSASDITEQRQGEEKLQDSQAQQRMILESALDAFIGTDSYGRITDWTRRAEEMFGWSRSEAIGRTLSETIIPPELQNDHRRSLARFHKSFTGPVRAKRVESTAQDSRGRQFPVEISLIPTKSGADILFHAFIRDISAQQKVGRQLRLTQFTVDHCADAVFWVEESANITYVNEAATRILGYTKEELVAMRIYDVDPYFTEARWRKFWRILRKHRRFRSTAEYRNRAGLTCPIEMVANYIVHEGSELCCGYAREVHRVPSVDRVTSPTV